MKKLLVASLLATTNGIAAANIYAGAGIGMSEVDIDSTDYHQVTLNGLVGFNLHSHVSTELGIGLGIKDDDSTTHLPLSASLPSFKQPVPGTQDVTTAFTLDHKITAAIKVHANLQSRFAPYFKLGGIYMENTIQLTKTNHIVIDDRAFTGAINKNVPYLYAEHEYKSHQFHYFAEVGADYKISDNISVYGSYFNAPELEFDDFNLNGKTQTIAADYSGFNLGVNIAF